MTVLGIRSQMLWNTTAYLKMITLSIDLQGKPENIHHAGGEDINHVSGNARFVTTEFAVSDLFFSDS